MPKIEPFELHTGDYEEWFVRNEYVYKSELDAVRKLLPKGGKGLEVGVGSGRFAAPLGVKYGIDPSRKMMEIAKKRGIEVKEGTGESIPFENEVFDYVLMVTTICFLDDVKKALSEVYRVLKPGGSIVVGFVDKDSEIGREYLKNKDKSVFYRDANFFSTEEVINLLKDAGFKNFTTVQTIFGKLDEVKEVQQVIDGYGKGSFVVIRGEKA